MKKLMFGSTLFWLLALVLFAVVFLSLSRCAFSDEAEKQEVSKSGSLTLMTWNVHNLFDGKDNGFEYNEFLESAGWSKEKYLGRINVISAAIKTLKPMPDIICLQEIESGDVLEALATAISGSYEYSHFADNPEAALGIGILSRFPIKEAKTHSITIDDGTTPRPVLETRIKAGEEEFVVFTCHWKSKLGGDDATENIRRASARTILRRARELWENEPNLGIIAAGDLNENHDDFYRRASNSICALLPDDPHCAELAGFVNANDVDTQGAQVEKNTSRQKDFIVLTGNKPPAPMHFPQGITVFFSPWLQEMENGSYFYRNNWETIDHFLVSEQFFDDSGWYYEKCETANFPPFANSDGLPITQNTRTGAGLSDHLPLLMTLKTEVKYDK